MEKVMRHEAAKVGLDLSRVPSGEKLANRVIHVTRNDDLVIGLIHRLAGRF